MRESIAWAAGSKKAGYNFSDETNEKITDGARDAFEKATGYVMFLHPRVPRLVSCS